MHLDPDVSDLTCMVLNHPSSGTMERNVLEYVDHLHEHFVYPVSINSQGRYNVPQNSSEGYSIQVRDCKFAQRLGGEADECCR